MSEKIEVGSVLTGKVTGIQAYGAFVALNETTQGLVHISEIKHGFVKDVSEHLSVGDEVNVKVLSINEEKGKISLSIRATEKAPEKAPLQKIMNKKSEKSDTELQGFNTLKDKLEEWIEQSNGRENLLKK
ncbi:S1 domain-containing post-transcriptional regulator GSP13 [Bacillus suaedaesalsae]|uniref:General stress protein 13 n=1 Tax=Bacillus suaedaesalsae TaxID=2810349 RepID=A0ABS2DMK1_9BACI|nr:S1 domain-containing post-transcriptional regulator GSP13 [Bacillus suaedaesalsae]MBM6618731.1 general stress protein 13 [Bacillus suaedaesalsae]